MTDYRVICSNATDRWNHNPSNRYTKARAEKLAAKLSKWCPGEHRVEAIS